jgi:hypothetical protein
VADQKERKKKVRRLTERGYTRASFDADLPEVSPRLSGRVFPESLARRCTSRVLTASAKPATVIDEKFDMPPVRVKMSYTRL